MEQQTSSQDCIANASVINTHHGTVEHSHSYHTKPNGTEVGQPVSLPQRSSKSTSFLESITPRFNTVIFLSDVQVRWNRIKAEFEVISTSLRRRNRLKLKLAISLLLGIALCSALCVRTLQLSRIPWFPATPPIPWVWKKSFLCILQSCSDSSLPISRDWGESTDQVTVSSNKVTALLEELSATIKAFTDHAVRIWSEPDRNMRILNDLDKLDLLLSRTFLKPGDQMKKFILGNKEDNDHLCWEHRKLIDQADLSCLSHIPEAITDQYRVLLKVKEARSQSLLTVTYQRVVALMGGSDRQDLFLAGSAAKHHQLATQH